MNNSTKVRRGRRAARLLVTAAVFTTLAATATAQSDRDAIFSGFLNPPSETFPSGGVSPSLDANAVRVQIDRLMQLGLHELRMSVVVGGMNAPAYHSDGWKAAMQNTIAAVGAAGMEVTINPAPGVSHTGDPTVKPQQAMKKLVWSITSARAGQTALRLPAPPNNSGPYQNFSADNSGIFHRTIETDLYRDVAVLAYRTPRGTPLPAPTITTSAGSPGANKLDGSDPKKSMTLAMQNGQAWVQLDYPAPQTVRTAILSTPETRGSNFISADLQVLGADGAYRTVTTIDMQDSPHVTVSFAPITAKSFRFVLGRRSGASVNANPSTDTQRGAPSAANTVVAGNELALAGAVLLGEVRVNQFERKGSFTFPNGDVYPWRTPDAPAGMAVAKKDVIDLTGRLKPDGALDWRAPAGDWTVLRLGYSLTGKVNHIATPDATGLEADKLNAAHIRDYFEGYLNAFQPASARTALTRLYNDSTEAGTSNWTENMLAEFKRLRGYDLLAYLPVLTGQIVDSAAASDKFLFDFRETVARLTEENTYHTMNVIANAHGITVEGEALEQNRRMIGDDLEIRRWSEIPTGALWSGDPMPDYIKDYPTGVADLRGAASVAHFYGRSLIGAESLTNTGSPNAFSPRTMKPMVDLEFVIGVNWLNRGAPAVTDTWAAYGADWVRYLARNCWMLRQGKFVGDVAYFYGEDAALVGIPFEFQDVPGANGFDFVSSESLLHQVDIKDGKMTSPSGMQYGVLQLGGVSDLRMSVPVLRRIRDLVQAGLVVTGDAPQDAPSLTDDPAEFAKLKAELWGADGKGAALGRGRVFAAGNLPAALAAARVEPDVTSPDRQMGTDVLFLHHKLADGEMYYVNHRSGKAGTISLSFRVAGKQPEIWRADKGGSEKVAYKIEGGRTVVTLPVEGNDAFYVMFRKSTTADAGAAPPPPQTLATIDGAWSVSFQPDRGAPATPVSLAPGSWTTQADAGVKYYSGAATYARDIDVPAAWLKPGAHLVLALGTVRDLAEVSVNGAPVGVRWTEPFTVDVTQALRPGKNRVAVKVTNVGVNRMIGDEQPGTTASSPSGTTRGVRYRADAPLRPSGLLGPVAIQRQP